MQSCLPSLLQTEEWSAAELDSVIHLFKAQWHHLQGSCVALLVERDLLSVAALLALLELQCHVIVPPTRDPLRRAQMLALSPIHLAPLLKSESSPLARHERTDSLNADAILELCSSGTLGGSKSVLLSITGLIASAQSVSTHWPSSARVGLSLPLDHVAGVGLVLRARIIGASLVSPSPPSLAAWARLQPSHWSAVPAQLLRWRVEDEERLLQLFQGTRCCILGGAPAPAPLLNWARQRDLPLMQSYGLTEMASTVGLTPLGDPNAPFIALSHCEVTCRQGELFVRGGSMALAIRRDGLICPLPLEGGWHATRDAGRLEGDGFRWCGRLDRVLNSGGEKIHPERIEEWLLARGACQAGVTGIDHPVWGMRPVAVCSPLPAAEETLKHELREQLGALYVPVHIFPAPPSLLNKPKWGQRDLLEVWQQNRSASSHT